MTVNCVLRRYDPLAILLAQVLCIISMVLNALKKMELPIGKGLFRTGTNSLDRNTKTSLQKIKKRKNNSFLIIEQPKKEKST